jgi:hypothetical protein
MNGGDLEAREMTRKLARVLQYMAATLSRCRRSVPSSDPSVEEIDAIDRAFEEPIRLARRLCVLHASSESAQAAAVRAASRECDRGCAG